MSCATAIATGRKKRQHLDDLIPVCIPEEHDSSLAEYVSRNKPFFSRASERRKGSNFVWGITFPRNTRPEGIGAAASSRAVLSDYSQVDISGARYKPVNFGMETGPGATNQ